jgi:hypothetical protein
VACLVQLVADDDLDDFWRDVFLELAPPERKRLE